MSEVMSQPMPVYDTVPRPAHVPEAHVIDFDYLAETGMVGWQDTRLFALVEKAEEGWAHIRNFWKEHRSA